MSEGMFYDLWLISDAAMLPKQWLIISKIYSPAKLFMQSIPQLIWTFWNHGLDQGLDI